MQVAFEKTSQRLQNKNDRFLDKELMFHNVVKPVKGGLAINAKSN